jgi:flagellar biosynthesis/type III secretory pathway protein FliH
MGIFDDLLGDTVDFFTGDVGNIVEDVVNVIKDDPIKAVAQAVAIGTGQAWAIPLIEGVDVVQNGGDLNDVVEGMAKVYVAQTVGTYTGQYVGTSTATGLKAAEYSATTADIAGKILGTGTGNAAVAVVLGQDPVEAFKLGGISAGVGAGLGQIEGYANLKPYQQTAISTGLATALSGQDITPELITASIIQAQATTDIIKDFTTENTSLSENQISLLANVVQTVAAGSFSGVNVSDAILGAIRKKGMTAFGDLFTDTVTSIFDTVTGRYGNLQDTSTKIKQEADNYTSNIDKYNATVKEMEPLIAEQNKLYAKTQDPEAAIIEAAKSDMFGKYIFNPATSISIVGTPFDPTNHDWVAAPEGPGFFISEDFRLGQRNRILAASKPIQQGYIQEYNDYATNLKDKYQPILEGYETAFDSAQANIQELQLTYDDQKSKLKSSAEELDLALEPIYDTVNQTFVEGIDANFNPDEYMEINNLTEDQDPYFHFLTEGKNQGLYTNLDAYNSSIGGIAENIADQAEIAQTVEPDPIDIALPITEEGFEEFTEVQDPADSTTSNYYGQPDIAPEDEGEPTDPDMAEEVKDIIDIIDKGKNLPLQEGFEEFTEVQNPDDPDLQQTDPFLEEYLDQIDEQGEAFYGADDTEFMAGDQGGPGSLLGELNKTPTKPANILQNQVDKTVKRPDKRYVAGEINALLEAINQQPEAELKEPQLAEMGAPYDFSSIFRNPEQEMRYRSPYSTNEELLKLVKGKV